MGTLLAFILLFALGHKTRSTGLSIPSAAPAIEQAARAQRRAHKAAQRAAQTNHPADHAAAAQAAQTAAVLTNHAATQAAAAHTVPPPWPGAVPHDLPPWPSGWKPYSPTPPAVVARAWQLLPILWKKGQGSKSVEQTGGVWTTYVAQYTSPGIKGVTAWKSKTEPAPAHRDQPVANA